MTKLLGTVSTLLKKLQPNLPTSTADAAEASVPTLAEPTSAQPEPERDSSLPTGDELHRLDAAQMRELLAALPERAVVRLLQQPRVDIELQLRIIREIEQEPALKRIARSQLDRKLKRAAEKRLRETGSGAEEERLRSLAAMGARVQTFLDHPRWPEARELLSEVRSPSTTQLSEGTTGEATESFRALRDRLEREVAEYERSLAEREEICEYIGSTKPISSSELARIRERWQDLEAKYPPPGDSPLRENFAQALEARARPRTRVPEPTAATPAASATPAAAAAPDDGAAQAEALLKQQRLEERRRREKQAESEKAESEKAKRQVRLEAVETLHRNLEEVGKNLAHREAGARLRALQAEATALKRWRREYAARLDEAEALVKTLASRHTEALDEARWDAWARTDRAVRIQAELRASIVGLEAEIETDPAAALRNSTGLAQRLFEYASEMKGLGSLERRKDHKIWVQFKALSDQGWKLCERLRGLILAKLKAELAELAAKPPVDFSGPFELKPSAFADDVVSRMRELQTVWQGLGPRPRELSRDLFEMYFRQLNLHVGRLRKVESNAAQRRRELVAEMKLAAEGTGPLLARLRQAQGVAEKWKRLPSPESVPGELAAEFDASRERLRVGLTEELEKLVVRTAALETQAQTHAAALESTAGTGLTRTSKAIAALDADLQGIEKYHDQLLQAGDGSTAEAERARFGELRARVRDLLRQCRDTATREVARRTQDRERLLAEAGSLALSTDPGARASFEELQTRWKVVGTLGGAQDVAFEALFENIRRFHRARTEAREEFAAAAALEKAHRGRVSVLCALEALTRFRGPATGASPLPFDDAERAAAAGKVLEAGFKYKQILSLDPDGGTLKETRKLMEQWVPLALPDEPAMAEHWRFYLERVRSLLGIT